MATHEIMKGREKDAMEISKKIGDVTVDMGNTACVVPLAGAYIKKKGSKRKNR